MDLMVFQVEVRWNIKQLGPVLREAIVGLEKIIQQRSKQDIATNVSGRFAKGLTTGVKRISRGYVIQVFQRPAFGKVWEYGGVSVGKPLLWIPVPGSPRRISRYGGKLFRPRGTRVLMSMPSRVAITGVMGSGQRKPQVKYIGVSSVTHRPRLHLRKIALEEANKFSQIMRAHMMR
jgi:hypothetical protein